MEKMQWAIDVLESNMEGLCFGDKLHYLQDVCNYGCSSGCVSGAIYNVELHKLFKDNLEGILEGIDDYRHDTGCKLTDFIENPLDIPTKFVWFIIEQTAGMMINKQMILPEEEENEEA